MLPVPLDAVATAGPDWPWVVGGMTTLLILVVGWLVLSLRGNFESHKTATKESIDGVRLMVENDRRDVVRPLVNQVNDLKTAIAGVEAARKHDGEELSRVRAEMVTREYFSSEMKAQNATLAGQNAMLADISRRLDSKVSVSSMPAVRTDGPYQIVDPRREQDDEPRAPRPRLPSTRHRDGE